MFYQFSPDSLPKGAQYYFNILVVTFVLSPQFQQEEEVISGEVDDIWFLDNLLDARPYIVHVYVDEEIDWEEEDVDFMIDYEPHCVVEVGQNGEICWYDMIDFDTEDPWRID